MLKCKVHSYLCCLWVASLLLLRDLSSAAPTEAQFSPCSITVSEPESKLDSISLTVTTPGQNCSFTVTSADTGADGVECRRRREGDEEIETGEIGGKERGEKETKEETGPNYLETNELGVEDEGNKETGDVFTCVLDHLEPGTTYQLQVQSQRDEETENITLHTTPSAVSGLTVTSRTSSSLGLSWQAGPGRTERFRLQLWDQTGLLRNKTLESTATQHTLLDLTPGRLYNVTMVTEAGGLQNSQTTEARTVPVAVSNLTVNHNDSKSFLLSWQQPEGDLDELVVTLSTNGTSGWDMTLPPDATEVAIHQLTPGSAYHISATTRSGELTSQAEINVRTAPAAASLLSLSAASSGGLFLSWTPPVGHWESYTVFLFDGSQQLVSTALDRETANFSFPGTGLTPGRLYKAVLRVESGGVTAESSCEGAT
ncbi:receptor-type tyrosine-protein phosphatase beta-like, partial [Plectropomus leopardus]|uniref:receptor-type tyrosine-protein phosphatase beta-like n=1 Tax=Plectropomus leopardus TaxID=160734 RepID=UPI001C4B0522